MGTGADKTLIDSLVAWTGETPTAIARAAGLAVTTLTRPANKEVNHQLSQPTLLKLRDAFPEFPGWSDTVVSLRRSEATQEDETVEIIQLDLSLSMGPGTLIDDWVEQTALRFDPAFVRMITRTPAHRLRMVTGLGDSMHPTLAHGDQIIVDTTDQLLARQDGIYWINLHGAAGLKRLRAIGKGKVLVKSDNPQVDDQEVDAEDLRIDGRAVWVMRGL